jgi:hypothetical protein
MFAESEIRDDMDKLRAHIDALIDKYGDEFSCVLSAGVSMDDAWAGSCLTYGKDYLIYQACHGLLENPKFIDEFFNAVKCVVTKAGEDKPEFLKVMMRESMDSLKRLLIMNTKSFKDHVAEEEADKAVKTLLKQAGFEN